MKIKKVDGRICNLTKLYLRLFKESKHIPELIKIQSELKDML